MPLALTAWVYYPVTGIFFWADDFYNLGDLLNRSALVWVLEPFAGHSLVARNLVFLALWRLFGLHSEPWYWTVFLTHLLNVWLLFGVVGGLTGSVTLACFGATLWGICPLALGAIGWYSVYGQVMVATVLLVVLDRLGRLAAADEALPARTVWVCYGLLLAGTTCFGIGVGVALVFPVVLFLLLPAAWWQPRVRLAYLLLPVVTLATYFGLRALSAWIAPLSDQMHLWAAATGLADIPGMLLPLLGFAVSGLTLGHWFDTARFMDAGSWAAIAGFIVGLGLVARYGDERVRRSALAMVALAGGMYATIAVGRAHVATMFGAPLARAAAEPRYHYAGTIPLVVLTCLALQQLGRIGRLSVIPRGLLLTVGLALPVGGYAISSFRIDQHPATREYVTRTLRELAGTVREAPPGTMVFIENGTTNPVLGPSFRRMLLPGRAGLFLFLSPAELPQDRQVRFVERDPSILQFWSARPHTRLGTLLVPPGAVGRQMPMSPVDRGRSAGA